MQWDGHEGNLIALLQDIEMLSGGVGRAMMSLSRPWRLGAPREDRGANGTSGGEGMESLIHHHGAGAILTSEGLEFLEFLNDPHGPLDARVESDGPRAP